MAQNYQCLWAILCVDVFALARIGELVPGHGSKLKVTFGAVKMVGNKGVLHLVGPLNRESILLRETRSKTTLAHPKV